MLGADVGAAAAGPSPASTASAVVKSLSIAFSI